MIYRLEWMRERKGIMRTSVVCTSIYRSSEDYNGLAFILYFIKWSDGSGFTVWNGNFMLSESSFGIYVRKLNELRKSYISSKSV